ncbi:hypothetical protein AMS68_002333 [Peltaster fructicola]|uniref:Uncharacterized protein n=1 Tax=Peltaster fructicola TaxID=286661 RepID=A0A6H0XQ48_9PEZI|nr:hypothetical protein AMS68_002333 [Peltaster fructicola]
MPRRLNPCSYLPRRLQIVVSIFVFCLFSIVLLGSTKHADPYLQNVPYRDELQEGARKTFDAAHQVVDQLSTIPQELNPFRIPAHKAPAQQLNSTSGETSWFTDFKWQNPFSDTVTLDEDRSVLPPEKNRPAIYTYFEPKEKDKSDKLLDAELELVNIWRRAWWAKGFKPMVLGRGEAMKNPLYQQAMSLKLEHDMEFEVLRWLAWSSMGTGILCNWLAVPMAVYDDTLLNFLRRGEFPQLTRFGDIGHGIFVGNKADIERATKSVVEAKNVKEVENFVDAIPSDLLRVDKKADAIAFYSGDIIGSKYQPIKEKFNEESTLIDGLTDLANLINSHLHTIWQNQFPMGIHVLKPMADISTHMIAPAIEIARNLSQCSWSPLPNSCPPNVPGCKTCAASSPLALHTPPVFRNRTDIFVIATVPHPYTMNCLYHQRADLNPKFIRRQTDRDKWILAATKEWLGTGKSPYVRLGSLKDAVASDESQLRSLWLTAETAFGSEDNTGEGEALELDWLFGFKIPRQHLKQGKSESPVPGPERRPPPPKPEFGEGVEVTPAELAEEKRRLDLSREFLQPRKRKDRVANTKLKNFVEAWNLADTEAWKFVRAFNARRSIERKKWEDEERAFIGQGLWDRLVDHIL